MDGETQSRQSNQIIPLVGAHRKGDPGLYGLHFPPGVNQTMHDHDSDRVVLVVSGSGCCFNTVRLRTQ